MRDEIRFYLIGALGVVVFLLLIPVWFTMRLFGHLWGLDDYKTIP